MVSIETVPDTAIYQIYVEKKAAFAVEADRLRSDLEEALGLVNVERLRIINRYFAAGLDDKEFALAARSVFAEVTVDDYSESLPKFSDAALVFAVEPLPGQFDQRGDSAAQCIQLQTQGERPIIRTAKIYVFYGELTNDEKMAIKRYLINPVESREASLELPKQLREKPLPPEPVAILAGFRDLDRTGLQDFLNQYSLAMSLEDLELIQSHFIKDERRDPTMTEIKVLDTYWSDHCRHTTFLTHINKVEFLGAVEEFSRIESDEPDFTDRLADSYENYLNLRHKVYGEKVSEKPVCLMDIGTIAMKALRDQGRLADLDQSPEINACSIKVTIEVDGRDVDYLVMFKNETHNHPTEIEPFGGAATCLGGAIRDPLSGRSYVYQAMRVTGAGNPNMPFDETLPGKLPQKMITKVAADGYSSYGNQIGIATGQVREIYHPGYVAKRMEVGAVIGAAPADQVIREEPAPGDVVLLIGGRTGRDGCGGATGSSRAHTDESVMKSGSEVQKGNPPVERQLQRLFRNPIAARMIKRCNDFGAGGVSVAVGELADGLAIDLDKVPVKYQGLTGTELAISESQERMAVVVRRDQAEAMIELADKENLEATAIATITEEPRMVMTFQGQRIVDLSRKLIDTNGASQETDVVVKAPSFNIHYFIPQYAGMPFSKRLRSSLGLLNACSQKGLASQFDSTIGAGTVLMPYGGMYQDTPEEGMVARIPTEFGETDSVTLMAYGFDPYLSEWSPYHGAYYAVLHSIAKITAMGGSPTKSRLSFQEYFPAMRTESHWGLPLSALLGALDAQMDCGVPAIGGKDSMSGTFENLEVPPTLISFAVGTRRSNAIHSATLTAVNSALYYIPVPKDDDYLPLIDRYITALHVVHSLQKEGRVHCTATVDGNGVAVRVAQMCFGNRLGFSFNGALPEDALFMPDPGALIVEVPQERIGGSTIGRLREIGAILLGHPSSTPLFTYGEASLTVEEALDAWQETLEPVWPTTAEFGDLDESKVVTLTQPDSEGNGTDDKAVSDNQPEAYPGERILFNSIQRLQTPSVLQHRPKVLIPVFPGTNCEYDSAQAFRAAGGEPEILIFRNLTGQHISESIDALVKSIGESKILMIPGGFSAGDEPDGSGKFIAAVLRNPAVTEAVRDLLYNRDGLMIGICNGFQALIKVGLLPYGDIKELTPEAPTLTFNTIGRHVSAYANTRVVSNRSPWLSRCSPGEVYAIPVSHGEGRFVATAEVLDHLKKSDQICTQYVNLFNSATTEMPANPNGSALSIEGICSPDGRIFGRMGHSERFGRAVAINLPGQKDMPIFESGIDYFN